MCLPRILLADLANSLILCTTRLVLYPGLLTQHLSLAAWVRGYCKTDESEGAGEQICVTFVCMSTRTIIHRTRSLDLEFTRIAIAQACWLRSCIHQTHPDTSSVWYVQCMWLETRYDYTKHGEMMQRWLEVGIN